MRSDQYATHSPEHVPQVKIAAAMSVLSVDNYVRLELVVELDHGFQRCNLDRLVVVHSNLEQVAGGERVHVHPGKPVQKRFRESFPPTALLHWVLARKQPETTGRALKRAVQFRDENFTTMVEARVQTFEDGLRRMLVAVSMIK